MSLYEEIAAQEPDVKGRASGSIQWKGINVCMDMHCICGAMGHVDADFFWHHICSACGARYAVGSVVYLIPLTDEQLIPAMMDFQTDTIEVYQP
jgi:hypothetical protein